MRRVPNVHRARGRGASRWHDEPDDPRNFEWLRELLPLIDPFSGRAREGSGALDRRDRAFE